MGLPTDLSDAISRYLAISPVMGQIRIFFALPLIVVALAALLGITIAEAIAIICTNGNMPPAFQWLCF